MDARYVTMHDLVRDLALRITSECPRYLVKAALKLNSIPDEECGKDDVVKKLPESVSDLVNLTALLLKRCEDLKYVPSLAKLKGLRKLDFFGAGINEVPQESRFNIIVLYNGEWKFSSEKILWSYIAKESKAMGVWMGITFVTLVDKLYENRTPLCVSILPKLTPVGEGCSQNASFVPETGAEKIDELKEYFGEVAKTPATTTGTSSSRVRRIYDLWHDEISASSVNDAMILGSSEKETKERVGEREREMRSLRGEEAYFLLVRYYCCGLTNNKLLEEVPSISVRGDKPVSLGECNLSERIFTP
ncbi:LRR domain containing protein [Parasponia andersonii]|uniref:LRR domain containing protein n=1 Tax=Parasponia andersonii TaxID=3476 RepID=A0A2P5DBD4_PARAD|nr:LRR domain containing protein [Parasponia andersonii]